MGKKAYRNEQIIVDHVTGEVLTTSKSYTVATNSEEFFMTFIGRMASFYQIKSLTDVKVLAFMCGIAEFNTGRVHLTAGKRKELIEKAKINNRQTVTNSIGRLKKLGLIAGDDGEYEIDPAIFWKGSTDERDRLLRKNGAALTIKFTPKTDDDGE